MSYASKKDSSKVIGSFTSSEQFWTSFLKVVPTFSKGYLGMYLIEAKRLYKKGLLNLDAPEIKVFAQLETTTAIDRRKTLDAFLPLAKTPEEAEQLINLLAEDMPEARINAMMKAATLPCCYLIFQQLRLVEGDRNLSRKVCIALNRKDDVRSHQLAALVADYFGLQDVPKRVMLKLKPYQLHRVENSYENFINFVT